MPAPITRTPRRLPRKSCAVLIPGRATRWPERLVVLSVAISRKSAPSATCRRAAGPPISPSGTSSLRRGSVAPLAGTGRTSIPSFAKSACPRAISRRTRKDPVPSAWTRLTSLRAVEAIWAIIFALRLRVDSDCATTGAALRHGEAAWFIAP
jgi:hypothetical protein